MNNESKNRICVQSPRRFPTVLVLVVTAGFVLGPICANAQIITRRNQHLFQSTFGILTEANDNFGQALVAGDFNGDGIDDLAIGIPSEDIGTTVDAGAVIVAYGSILGLNQGQGQAILLHQGISGTADSADTNDQFGWALAAGDFNNSGYSDLAVGVPRESFELSPGVWVDEAGAVQVFLGLPNDGIDPAIDVFIRGSSFPGTWDDHHGDRFGISLATGDRNLDLYDDLMIGIPGSPLDESFEGVAMIVPGGPSLFQFDQGAVLAPAGREPEARFGWSVVMGDLDGIGALDQVVGAVFGELTGPVREGWTWLNYSNLPVETFPGYFPDVHLGTALAVGDFRGAGFDQVLMGAPGYEAGGHSHAGEIRLHDHTTDFYLSIMQGYGGVLDNTEPGDEFGTIIGVGDFNADGYDDAVCGVPLEDLYDDSPQEKSNAGVVNIIYGGPDGFSATGSQLWTLDNAELSFGALAGDRFGAAVAAGDFNGDGVDDLAIGAPGASIDGQNGAGMVTILYGQPFFFVFHSGFDLGDFSGWSVVFP